jgi:hypothetical protein
MLRIDSTSSFPSLQSGVRFNHVDDLKNLQIKGDTHIWRKHQSITFSSMIDFYWTQFNQLAGSATWSVVVIGSLANSRPYADIGYPMGFSQIDITPHFSAVLRPQAHSNKSENSRSSQVTKEAVKQVSDEASDVNTLAPSASVMSLNLSSLHSTKSVPELFLHWPKGNSNGDPDIILKTNMKYKDPFYRHETLVVDTLSENDESEVHSEASCHDCSGEWFIILFLDHFGSRSFLI